MNDKKKGFTLIEVLVAVAIFAILVIPIGNLISQSVKINFEAKKKAAVATVLNEAIEQIYHDVRNRIISLPREGEYHDVKYISHETNTYIVEYDLKRMDANYDFWFETDSVGKVSVYERVYDSVTGIVKYDNPMSFLPSTNDVKIEVLYNGTNDEAIYNIGILTLNVKNPKLNAKYGGKNNTVSFSVYGVYDMFNPSQQLSKIFYIFTPNSYIGQFTTDSNTIKFVDEDHSKFFNEIIRVHLSIYRLPSHEKIKESNFVVRR